jgi:RimJ/RimL family protein N-acetyltransferase
MTHDTNALGQPIGRPVPGWQPPPRPARTPMSGRFCRLEAADPARHAADLHAANGRDAEGAMWTYLPYGPFADLAAYRTWMESACTGADPHFHAIVDLASGKAVGLASYLRIDPANGAIEVGHLAYSPLLQRTPAATEAMFLMMRWAFSAGYRRYEWKCNVLNTPSRSAAMRLGFSYEGVFRQASIVKGRNRDTAWYAAIDSEWPALEQAYRTWLAPENFDGGGRQRRSLASLTSPILTARG